MFLLFIYIYDFYMHKSFVLIGIVWSSGAYFFLIRNRKRSFLYSLPTTTRDCIHYVTHVTSQFTFRILLLRNVYIFLLKIISIELKTKNNRED